MALAIPWPSAEPETHEGQTGDAQGCGTGGSSRPSGGGFERCRCETFELGDTGAGVQPIDVSVISTRSVLVIDPEDPGRHGSVRPVPFDDGCKGLTAVVDCSNASAV